MEPDMSTPDDQGMSAEERAKIIRGLCAAARASTRMADHFIASDLTIPEIQRELTDWSAHINREEVGMPSEADMRLTPAERAEKFAAQRLEWILRRRLAGRTTEYLLSRIAEQRRRGLSVAAVVESIIAWLKECDPTGELRPYLIGQLMGFVFPAPSSDVDRPARDIIRGLLRQMQPNLDIVIDDEEPIE